MTSDLHQQWKHIDFSDLLSRDVALLSFDAQNSILEPTGVLSHEGIWRNARQPGGSLYNALRLAKAAKAAKFGRFWLRYDRFIGEREPTTELDRAQYAFWNATYDGDQARKAWEADLVPEVKEIIEPDDVTLIYPRWSAFSGTSVQRWLNQRGMRTLLIFGYHTDWCVEMTTRHARELGFQPIVIGDASGSTEPLHSQSLAQINEAYAPVISTDAALGFIEAGARRRAA